MRVLTADEQPFELTLLDSARFLNYRILFLLIQYCPGFEAAASALLLLVFKLRPPPPPPSACPFGGGTCTGVPHVAAAAAAATAATAAAANGWCCPGANRSTMNLLEADDASRRGEGCCRGWRAAGVSVALLAVVVGGVLMVWVAAAALVTVAAYTAVSKLAPRDILSAGLPL